MVLCVPYYYPHLQRPVPLTTFAPRLAGDHIAVAHRLQLGPAQLPGIHTCSVEYVNAPTLGAEAGLGVGVGVGGGLVSTHTCMQGRVVRHAV